MSTETRYDEPRLRTSAWRDGYRALSNLAETVRNSSIDPTIYELIKMRASQINQCAFCLDMHSKDARAQGETEQRLYALSAWRETSFYTERERAALALTEAVTLVADTHVPDDVIDEAKECFDDEELMQLLFAIIEINAWNRLAITVRSRVGDYQPAGQRAD